MVDIVITYYDPEGKKLPVFVDCVRSVGECSRGEEYRIITVHNGPSYCESVNRGLRQADGDFVIVMNDDLVVKDPKWIKKLCVPGVVSAWQLGGFHLIPDMKVPDAACFAMDRETLGKLGLMDERYKDGINFEDTDYWMRAKELGIPFRDAKVRLRHIGNVTQDTYYADTKWDRVYKNEALFRQKWSV